MEEKHLGHLTHAKAHIAVGVSGIRPRTEVIKPAQAKSKAYKILGVSESQINWLGCIFLIQFPPHHNMNYNILCFQTPIPAPLSPLFRAPYGVHSLAEAVSSCLAESQADQHHLVAGEEAASFSS